jgi:hypothetical protein
MMSNKRLSNMNKSCDDVESVVVGMLKARLNDDSYAVQDKPTTISPQSDSPGNHIDVKHCTPAIVKPVTTPSINSPHNSLDSVIQLGDGVVCKHKCEMIIIFSMMIVYPDGRRFPDLPECFRFGGPSRAVLSSNLPAFIKKLAMDISAPVYYRNAATSDRNTEYMRRMLDSCSVSYNDY